MADYEDRVLVSKDTSELGSQSVSVYVIIYSQGRLYQNRALVSKDTNELDSQSLSVYVYSQGELYQNCALVSNVSVNWAVSQ